MSFLFRSIDNFFEDLLSSFFFVSAVINGLIRMLFLSTLFAGRILCVEKSIF